MRQLRLLISLPSFRTSVVPPSTGVLFSFLKIALLTPFFMLQYRQIYCLMLGSDSLTEVAYGARFSYKIPLPVGNRAFQKIRQTSGLFQSVFFRSAWSNRRHCLPEHCAWMPDRFFSKQTAPLRIQNCSQLLSAMSHRTIRSCKI